VEDGVIHMKKTKMISVVFSVVFCIILLNFFWQNINKPQFDFDKVLSEENSDDLVFKLYYGDPNLLYVKNMTVQEFLKSGYYFFCVEGKELEEYYDLFRKINSDTLVPFKGNPVEDCSIYYKLESKKNGKIFDVAIGGYDIKKEEFCIYFNGYKIESNQVFYDLYTPLLPEHLK